MPNDTASTNVEMADFTVAHQAFRKTDGQRRSLELGVRSILLQAVHDGSVGSTDGIALLVGLLSNSPPIDNDYPCVSEEAKIAGREE